MPSKLVVEQGEVCFVDEKKRIGALDLPDGYRYSAVDTPVDHPRLLRGIGQLKLQ